MSHAGFANIVCVIQLHGHVACKKPCTSPSHYLRRFVPSLLFVPSVTCCLRMLSSSALRSLPGQAQIRASKQRRPSTWPLETKVIMLRGCMAFKSSRDHIVKRQWTYSLVSRVTIMRIGRLFIPPTQLELHIKLYRIVVNSVPTCSEKTQHYYNTTRNLRLEHAE